MFYIFDTVAYVWFHATSAANTAHNKKCWTAHDWAEAHHWAVLFVELDFSLVQSFEFSLDNSDARYTGHCRRGLRMRFYMIVYGLFYLVQWKDITQSTTVVWLTGVQGFEVPPW